VAPGAHTRTALADWGVPDVDALLESGVAVQSHANRKEPR
jgi:alpha-methylacyl-CoA racemase